MGLLICGAITIVFGFLGMQGLDVQRHTIEFSHFIILLGTIFLCGGIVECNIKEDMKKFREDLLKEKEGEKSTLGGK